MGCLSCFKPSKESKENWKCWKGKLSKDDETLRKRKRRGFCGLCGKRSLKDGESPRKQGSTCCFFCKRSSKDEKASKKLAKTNEPSTNLSKKKEGLRKKGKKDSSEEPLKRKGDGCMSCLLCCKPKKDKKEESKGHKKKTTSCCCFGHTKSSSEDPSKRKGEGCMSCFHGCKPKKDKKEGKGGREKATTCCCLPHTKRSSEESTKRKGEGCMSCFWCFKSSKKDKEEELKRDNDKASSRSCVKSSEAQSYFSCFRPSSTKAKGCFPCFKSSKKKESRKCAGKATTTKPSDGKACKSKCTKNTSCSCGCTCCSSSSNKKVKKKPTKKVQLSWRKKGKKKRHHLASLVKTMSFTSDSSKQRTAAKEILRIGNGNIAARVFTYCELVTATKNFASECLLGEGGFGKVYKGHLKDSNRDIAVKKLDKKGYQGNREFLIEVLMLSLLSHPNLVNLIGYCADGNERILVYDYMPLGSLQDHLTGLHPDSKPLDWNTRMKIAAGAAKGLEHLHDTANPPVIYRDLKPSNILLDDDFNPRLADFGLAKLGPVGAKEHVSTRVMGTFGYCAPEYALTGKLTKMSDIYSFGVVLLELITGRKAIDTTRPRKEQILVEWAAPLFKDKRNFIKMADPLLKGNFPVKALYQAVAISSMCLQEKDNIRPLIKDVVCALQFLAIPEGNSPSSSEHEKSVIENQIPPEPQESSPTEKSTSDSSEEEPRHSSDSDWQSCSTSRRDIEELRENDDM